MTRTTTKAGKILAASSLLALLSGSAFAATQGTLGATSTGSANISITKSVQAQITDLQDMTLSSWSVGQGNVTLYTNACIYSSTGNYTVTATGSGTSNAFTVASGSNIIPYTVNWNAAGAGALTSSGTALTTNVQSTSFGNASTNSATCNGGGSSNDTARVIVGVSSASMTAATGSTTPYTGTLTMLITPY